MRTIDFSLLNSYENRKKFQESEVRQRGWIRQELCISVTGFIYTDLESCQVLRSLHYD